jgi:hypothetical protein
VEGDFVKLSLDLLFLLFGMNRFFLFAGYGTLLVAFYEKLIA